MGAFDGIESVTSTSGGEWIVPGNHVFRVNALKMPQNLRAGDCFIGELTVVESDTMREGASVSWVRNITKHREMALTDIKQFLAAVAHINEEEVDQDGANEAVSEDQPLAGRLVKCEAYNRQTQSGNDFTRTSWSCTEE